MDLENYTNMVDYYRLQSDFLELQKYVDKLEEMLFTLGAMTITPCFRCGYNGPDYYQPETHSCASKHHEFYSDNQSTYDTKL